MLVQKQKTDGDLMEAFFPPRLINSELVATGGDTKLGEQTLTVTSGKLLAV